MAIYRFSAAIIKRSSGRSAVAAAAYRAGDRLEDAQAGRSFDYRRRRGILHAEIIAPDDAPDWMLDRQQLWHAVEIAEKRKDAQLAREIQLALPHELTAEQRLDLVRSFVRDEFVANGMVADVAIHTPDRDGDERNHHAHVMLTMRSLTGDGFGNKCRAWNDSGQLEDWRAAWADHVNRALEQAGHDARVDHRSYLDQGIDREAEPKLGPAASEMERDGTSTERGDLRRDAQERNARRAQLEAELAAAEAELSELKAANDNGQQEMVAMALDDDMPEERARLAAIAEEQARLQVEQIEEMRRTEKRIREYLEQQRREAEARHREEEERARRQREDEARTQEQGQVREAGERYAQALGKTYNVLDPYGSLARAAMQEHAEFRREQEERLRLIAAEQDAQKREQLIRARQIEAAEYMAITSRRIAKQSEIITGRTNSEEAVKMRERAAEFERQAAETRKAYRAGEEERLRQAQDHARRETAERDDKARQERRNEPPKREAERQRPEREKSDAARAKEDAERNRQVSEDLARVLHQMSDAERQRARDRGGRGR